MNHYFTIEDIKKYLDEKLQETSWQLSEDERYKMAYYLFLLHKWNRAYNLTSVDTIPEMVVRHIFDSLVVAPHLQGQNILDVGSGAGLPGIPLAITHPDRQFVLLDSNGKKTRFLWQVCQELFLHNVTVEQMRVEDFQMEKCFTTVTSRAFAELKEFIAQSQRLCCPDGVMLAMKGAAVDAEVAALEGIWKKQITVHELQVPGLEATRCVVEVKNQNISSGQDEAK